MPLNLLIASMPPHWLPVHLRIEFKVLLLVYKALHGMAPDYLSNMLSPARSVRNLRSRNQCLLAVPRTNLVSAGDRAFSVAGPKLWNKLPMHIKQSSNVCVFKRKLKTHVLINFTINLLFLVFYIVCHTDWLLVISFSILYYINFIHCLTFLLFATMYCTARLHYYWK